MNLLILAGALALHPALEQHCFRCHGGDETEGGFDLSASTEISAVQWREAIALVERREMPDEGPAPDATDREAILAWLRARRDECIGSRAAPDPVPSRSRLTNVEYDRAMRDLLGIDLRPSDYLSPDPPGETGFTNDRLALALDQGQVLKYLEAAERSIEALEGLRNGPRTLVHWEAEEIEKSTPHLKDFDKGRLFATEPQLISAPVEIPVDGYYEIRLHGSTMGKPTVAQILEETKEIAAVRVTHPRPTSVTHVVPVLLRKGWRNLSFNQRNLVPQASLPRDADRVMNERAERNRMQVPELPPDATAEQVEARQVLIDKCFYLQQSFEWLFAHGTGGDPRDIVRIRQYAEERLTGEVETRHWYAGEILGIDPAVFDREWERLNGDKLHAYHDHMARIGGIKWMDWTQHQGQLYLDWIEIVGPVIPPGADPIAPARVDVKAFAAVAWGGALSDDAWSRLGGLGGGNPLVAILASPRFLLRDDQSLPSRLSWFLGKSLPDPELFRTGWDEEAGVRRQIRRLMADERFEGAVRDFLGQWLGTVTLGRQYMPDEYRFPAYRRNVAEAAREEPVQFFLRLIREKRSIHELVETDWSVVNADLAAFYGVEPPGDGKWKKVSWSGTARGGLLGMSGVLAVTSNPVRTSPMARGKFVWESLMGRKIGEPPGDAGILPATAGEQRGLTLREEMERHRNDPRCVRCHQKIDPIGLALENFDAVGRWRTTMAGKPIVVDGRFYRGASFSGPVGLKQQLLERRDEVAFHLTRKLMEYASGRSMESRLDEVDAVLERVRDRDHQAAALFEEVAFWLVTP